MSPIRRSALVRNVEDPVQSASPPSIAPAGRTVGPSIGGAEDALFEEYFAENANVEEDEVHIHGMEQQRDQQEEEEREEADAEQREAAEEATRLAAQQRARQHSGASRAHGRKIEKIEDEVEDTPNTSSGVGQQPQTEEQQPLPQSSHRIASDGPADSFASAAGTVSSNSLCPAAEAPNFLRHQWLPEEQGATAANFVRKMDSLEACARLCRDNVEPFGGRHFACHGFTYIGQRNARNACEFFDDHLAVALEKKPPLGAHKGVVWGEPPAQFAKNYFERICLQLPTRCTRLSFAFEVHPRRALKLAPEERRLSAEQVDDRKQCLQQCLDNGRCKSLDFDTANLTCSLFAQSHHTVLGAPEDAGAGAVGQLVESADVDHYENTCLTELDRCGSRHLAFVLVRNAELAGFSVGLGKQSLSDCLTRCIDSPPAFCRSVQFHAAAGECHLGTERPLAPLPSDEMDIFEPICLPDPPQTSTLECLGEHVFERVPNMELRTDEAAAGGAANGHLGEGATANGTDLFGVPLERCLDACILDESCVSLTHRAGPPEDNNSGGNHSLAQCRLFAYGRGDNSTLAVIHPNVDYFELSCTRTPLSKAELERIKAEEMAVEKAAVTTVVNSDDFGAPAGPSNASSPPHQSQTVRLAGTTLPQPPHTMEETTLATPATTPRPTAAPTVPPPSSTVHPTTPTTTTTIGTTTASAGAVPSTPPQSIATSTTTTVGPTTAGGNCSATGNSSLLERGRTLRIEQRQQHHVNVKEVLQCERICAKAKAIRCASFAYSARSRDCLLSTNVLRGRTPADYTALTQPNANFELFAFVGGESCGREETQQLGEQQQAAIEEDTDQNEAASIGPHLSPFTTTSISTVRPKSILPDLTPEGEGSGTTVLASSPRADIAPTVAPLQSTTEAPVPATTNNSSTATTVATTSSTVVGVTEAARTAAPTRGEEALPATSDPSWAAPPPSPHSGFPISSISTSSSSAASSPPSSRIAPEQIRTSAVCDEQGVNVTFLLSGGARYSGVVYAADRFAHCRLFVESAGEFSFYVNRPKRHTNWCNAAEVNGELNVVLVLSNDLVLPLDVTTKDDLFFHVACDYGAGMAETAVDAEAFPVGIVKQPVRPGTVIVGAESLQAASRRLNGVLRRPFAEPDLRREYVRLKILRDGRPVTNVFIGERLSAVVETNDVDVERIRVAECNATRVGGRVPRPSAIQLLNRDGCSLNPLIIGDMVRHGSRLEAPLHAFRIDGSDQIDIICSVVLCRLPCARTPTQCASLRHPKRAQRAPVPLGREELLPLEAEDIMTVDQRIRVLVSGEEERELEAAFEEDRDKELLQHKGGLVGKVAAAATGDVELASRAVVLSEGAEKGGATTLLAGTMNTTPTGDICLNPVVLLLLLLLLMVALCALFVSLVAHWCKRRGSRQHNFYPASTELSSHHFHIPRILDRNYAA